MFILFDRNFDILILISAILLFRNFWRLKDIILFKYEWDDIPVL